MIIHVVAFDQNKGIGLNNKLPWHFPEDLKHFFQLTRDKPIFIGFNTYLSLLEYAKNREELLPTRDVHVVLTRELPLNVNIKKGVTFIDKTLVDLYVKEGKTIIIAGGTSMYTNYPPNVVLATEVQSCHSCDTHYPVNLDTFLKFSIKESLTPDQLHYNMYCK